MTVLLCNHQARVAAKVVVTLIRSRSQRAVGRPGGETVQRMES